MFLKTFLGIACNPKIKIVPLADKLAHHSNSVIELTRGAQRCDVGCEIHPKRRIGHGVLLKLRVAFATDDVLDQLCVRTKVDPPGKLRNPMAP